MQVLGKIPTISINKTDGCHVYLSKDSLSCEIVSAKSSEMNVLVPGKDGDYVSDVEKKIRERNKLMCDSLSYIRPLFCLLSSRLRSQSLNNSKLYGMAVSWSPQQLRLQDRRSTSFVDRPLNQCLPD